MRFVTWPRQTSKRQMLCAATGMHDRRDDGTCADCGTVIGDQAVCADDVLIHAQPDEPQR